MAIYKIFSEKDTYISSYYSTQNFGRDEILEISNETSNISLNSNINRALIQFPTNQINNTINNLITGSFTSHLKLFLATALIPLEYSIEVYPISQSWIMGLGRSANEPKTLEGCTWLSDGNNNWLTPGGDYLTSISSSQFFTNISNKDINLNITNLVISWHSGSLENYGVILKYNEDIENSNNDVITKFFSMDTHTIYPPQLEFKWDDSNYNTTLSQITTSDFTSNITNNKSEFEENTIYKFKIKARDKYPTRQFTTTSVYTNTKALPSSSYWALKDIKTEEMIIDFDTTYTKISCDNNSNYFTIYMDGLEPERYYQILYKVILPNNETIIIDNKSNYFKIVR
jgi:hypothetical protein